MEITETLYVTNRRAWRRWLRTNHNTKNEIWLVYYKKHTNKSRIPYDDAVEEAICFGWIDSTVKRLDNERYVQKFTPRKIDSIWSVTNIRRAKIMISKKKMTKAGMVLFNEAKKQAHRNNRARIVAKELTIPDDLKTVLQKNHTAARNFKKFAPSYQKMYIWYILSAKRPDTRKRRIKKVVELAAQNKKSVML